MSCQVRGLVLISADKLSALTFASSFMAARLNWRTRIKKATGKGKAIKPAMTLANLVVVRVRLAVSIFMGNIFVCWGCL